MSSLHSAPIAPRAFPRARANNRIHQSVDATTMTIDAARCRCLAMSAFFGCPSLFVTGTPEDPRNVCATVDNSHTLPSNFNSKSQ